jgi:short-subunit dehydrogenase
MQGRRRLFRAANVPWGPFAGMKRELQGKRIAVTGASSGIGLALAQALAQEGAKLVLAARSEGKLQEVARSGPVETLVVPTDVTKDEDRQRLLDRAVERFGGLDVLINNAGVCSWAHFAESNEEVLRTIMEVNFFGPADLIRRAIPILTRGQQPAIVNVASMCGRRGMPSFPEYSASKFALCGLTESLRAELARFEIDVLLILPGLTDSALADHYLLTKGRADIDHAGGMDTAYVAKRIVRSLKTNKTETVLGREARWLLRFNKFLPRFTDWLIARKIRKLYSTVS